MYQTHIKYACSYRGGPEKGFSAWVDTIYPVTGRMAYSHLISHLESTGVVPSDFDLRVLGIACKWVPETPAEAEVY